MIQRKINELFVDMATNNDEESFRLLYDHCFVRVLRFSYSLTRSREVAEEITNDVFLHCWQKRASLQHIRNPEVYLFVVARNKAIDFRRKQANFHHVDLLEDIHVEIALESNPEEMMISAEMVRRLELSIEQLPPKCKMIYLLIKQYGLKYQEVANILNLSIKTVENQLSIAVKRLTTAVKFSFEKEEHHK
ncbi:RNA polymerase sigma-70 factor [Chitinophaga caeni]|uniref:RNA polymerase sigma-70 factor n=1 Tax=Chitinophaga caeni TaxID=2029983 RepID=A0A291QP80_9BACT|nr:RNA polymerase sigma-70 factor [Chitinophaga caeni]ATL45809.1 RNA polymerase sigma-70 factor [Chitinophaga caeni]